MRCNHRSFLAHSLTFGSLLALGCTAEPASPSSQMTDSGQSPPGETSDPTDAMSTSTADPADDGTPMPTGTTGATTANPSDETTGGDSSDDGPSIIFDVGGGAETGDPTTDPCTNASTNLTATVRDFTSSHPDFEAFWGGEATTDLVLFELGADSTPQYNPAPPPSPPGSSFTQITSAATFADWYHDTPGTNVAEQVEIELVETPPGSGIFVFADDNFFPIDNAGWNAAPGPNNETFPNDIGEQHNFHFTTEIHTSFVYEPGQVFNFNGDDDLWIFVDQQLAMDLGGLHGALDGSIELDTLMLQPGQTYSMDIFHAERRHDGSHFRLETSIVCFLPPVG